MDVITREQSRIILGRVTTDNRTTSLPGDPIASQFLISHKTVDVIK